MISFTYTIKDPIGIHARPAGLLVQEAKKYKSSVLLSCHGKTVLATKLLAVMTMGVGYSDVLSVQIEGDDEDIACSNLQAFFSHNL